jgi:hypothetical protein
MNSLYHKGSFVQRSQPQNVGYEIVERVKAGRAGRNSSCEGQAFGSSEDFSLRSEDS